MSEMRNITWQNIGLLIFVLVNIEILAVLLYDWHLYVIKQPMITDYARTHPWFAFLLLLCVCVGMLGLAVHFMAPVKVVFND